MYRESYIKSNFVLFSKLIPNSTRHKNPRLYQGLQRRSTQVPPVFVYGDESFIPMGSLQPFRPLNPPPHNPKTLQSPKSLRTPNASVPMTFPCSTTLHNPTTLQTSTTPYFLHPFNSYNTSLPAALHPHNLYRPPLSFRLLQNFS